MDDATDNGGLTVLACDAAVRAERFDVPAVDAGAADVGVRLRPDRRAELAVVGGADDPRSREPALRTLGVRSGAWNAPTPVGAVAGSYLLPASIRSLAGAACGAYAFARIGRFSLGAGSGGAVSPKLGPQRSNHSFFERSSLFTLLRQTSTVCVVTTCSPPAGRPAYGRAPGRLAAFASRVEKNCVGRATRSCCGLTGR